MKIFNNDKNFETIKFNYFWKFSKKNINITYEEALQDLDNYNDVVLPHDYLIYQVNDLYETSSGWYYKEFNLDKLDKYRYFINFDGVYMDSSIYINHKLAYEWKNGYSAFEIDITDYCLEGKNNIVVKVNHEHPNSRWYSGAGIYRDVYIKKKELNHIKTNGIYINTNALNNEIYINTELNLLENAILEHSILFEDKLIAKKLIKINNNLSETTIKLNNIKLWSIDKPNLYILKTKLIIEDTIYDIKDTKFGFKDVMMDPNKGFFLNGINIKLNGVCEHHDLGAFGAAFSKKILKNRLVMLKDMGVNAIRTAHSIPAKGLMELADEMGFLVVSEAFDMWKLPKNPYDYARFFDEWVSKDVESWIKRDRNHVSLLMWSIGNEIYDTHASLEGVLITKKIKDLIIKYDPKLNGKLTIGSNFLMGENTQKAANELKIVGYNYLESLYEEHHIKFPEWVIYGSETSSIVKSRGIYHFPLEEQILYHEDMQCSSLGNSLTSWGSKSLEESITIDRDTPYSLGQFIWTGHDYIGEPTPYETKNSYFGQIDTAGFPKDSYFVHKASWNKQETLHLFPYWNFNEGELIDVRVATNAHLVELYLNNKLLETKKIDIKKDKAIIPTFKVPYEEGELKIISYDNNENKIDEYSNNTFYDPKSFKITLLENEIKADNEDITELIIETIDENGNLVSDDNQFVKIEIEGPGRLLGLDNGDSTDYLEYKTNIKPMFSGKLKAYIGSTYNEGSIKVLINSENIKSSSVEINAIKAPLCIETKHALETKYNIRSYEIKNINENTSYVPIRNIKLKANNKIITKNDNKVFIETKIYPENATDKDIKYSIVTKKGIPTDIAEIEKISNGIYVKGIKDGAFILRATANNFKKHPAIISELTFEVKNIGVAYKNPYNFITAGLYDEAIGEIKSGNEHGVATSSQEQTEIIFNNINFNNTKSNEISLSIFSFESNPLWIKIYARKSNEEEFKFIDKLTYQKETIWNVYQDESYILKEVLDGILDIKLVFERSVHFKGFQFNEIYDNNRLISILEANTYYGDRFTKTNWGFSDIGNNTTFIFDELNFKKEVNKITIEGMALLEANSIRIILTNREKLRDTVQVEFIKNNDFTNQTFDIKPIVGKYKVEFVFLPGSNFNFKTFKFT